MSKAPKFTCIIWIEVLYVCVCRYEPELHAAANFKIASTGANIKIYQNGAMAGTAKNVQTLSEGIQEIYRNA